MIVTSDPAEQTEPGTRVIGSADFVGSWPLTIDPVTLRCEPPSRVTVEANGTAYGINGMAIGAGYPEVNPIWRDNPEIDGTKINIGPLIQAGLALCE